MSSTDDAKDQILVIHDGDLTQVVQMLASAQRIREHHKKARITLLCGEEFEGLLKHCPYFNAVETNLDDAAKRNFFERMKAARNSGFDVIYDLCGSESAKKIGRAARFTRTKWIKAGPDSMQPGHALDQMAARLGEAGLGGPTHYRLGEAPAPDLSWIDFVAKRSRTLDPAYFGLQGAYALFAPAGEDSAPALRWPKERWASLAHELIELGVEPVVVGGPSTREVGRYVAHMTPGARDLTGRANLIQLAGLGRRASCAFGESAGLLHLMAAAGSPTVLFHPGEQPPHEDSPRGQSPTLLMHAPTLAQISALEAVQAMRCAGGFSDASHAA